MVKKINFLIEKKCKFILKEIIFKQEQFLQEIFLNNLWWKIEFKKNKQCDKIADDVMKNGILLGCHQGMVISDLKYICNTFEKFLKNEVNKNWI